MKFVNKNIDTLASMLVKTAFLILLAAFAAYGMFSITGCSSQMTPTESATSTYVSEQQRKASETVFVEEGDRFEFETFENGRVSVITDKETGCQYLLANNLGSIGGMTVLLDSDGKPLLNEEYAAKKTD